jgi:hypothetical protein
MKTLFIISLVSLALSFLTDLIFNLIIMPVKKDVEKDTESPHYVNDNDLKSYYLLIENGGFLFFILFSILFLIVAYSAKHSILWTLLCIPGLFFLYFVLNMISAFLSRVLGK